MHILSSKMATLSCTFVSSPFQYQAVQTFSTLLKEVDEATKMHFRDAVSQIKRALKPLIQSTSKSSILIELMSLGRDVTDVEPYIVVSCEPDLASLLGDIQNAVDSLLVHNSCVSGHPLLKVLIKVLEPKVL